MRGYTISHLCIGPEIGHRYVVILCHLFFKLDQPLIFLASMEREDLIDTKTILLCVLSEETKTQ